MRKIFLVEDNQAIREVLEIFLTAENYSVQTFETVKEFDERDLNAAPDLFIFDVMLPDGSGIDLCKQIKNSRENQGTPVIIMSAHAKLHEMTAACEPDDFISKPFDIDNLLERIKKLLSEVN
ncbi:response regulator transcription factor [Chryseobacterium daeguense]|uniref:response regulator transcription factor n=1 Tax=Chryseobacterium daeguense TaxID=412438 RepID=UPI0004021874|nr:response regulator transcription factor [Chryseobacterium daeguense]